MRIFLVLHPSANMAVPGSMTWYRNLYEPLLDLGHDVFFFRLDQFVRDNQLHFRTPSYRDRLSVELVKSFRNEHSKKPFDIFFAYLTSLDITPECLESIRQMKVPMLNFSCNNTHQFHLVEPIARYFSFNLHSEKYAAQKFDQAGAPKYWFQMAANPKYYKPLGLELKYNVAFVGMNYAKRAGYINHLLSSGINVNCFGGGWVKPKGVSRIKKNAKEYLKLLQLLFLSSQDKRLENASYIRDSELIKNMRSKYSDNFFLPVTDNQMIEIFNQSKINLGFLEVYCQDNNASSGVQQHLHLREFEVPMSGGLYFTNYSDELAEFFEPDREVVTFRNEYELLDKIHFYLNHSREADKIKEAGYKRALNDHTFQKRLKSMFRELKLSNV